MVEGKHDDILCGRQHHASLIAVVRWHEPSRPRLNVASHF